MFCQHLVTVVLIIKFTVLDVFSAANRVCWQNINMLKYGMDYFDLGSRQRFNS